MKASEFRALLQKKRNVVLAGAHDALSAKLIEEAGFDAVWASSFGISASTRCLPDANVLTMTESLEAVKGMNEAVRIPVIADCDNGYGNAHNVIRMVREYERAGLAGISIEDNPFPKKCSLYPGERPELVETEEMAGRIHAAKATQRSRDFFVIARTEALIAGLGMEEALIRARAYEAAGADAVLIHSRQPRPDEIRVFASRWDGKVPLVAVPTKYPDVTAAELGRMGIRIVIFANQALRASVTAMKDTLQTMRRQDRPGAVEKKVAPLSEIFRLVGQPDMEANDLRYVRRYKRGPAAVIVAAGFEKELWPLNRHAPKAMLEIRGKSILERQTELLKSAGVERIAVVTGYKREKIHLPSIVKYPNPRYRDTHILHSLFRAEAEMHDRFLFLYGDVLFEDFVIDRLLKSRRDITLVVRRREGGESASAGPAKPERDWVVTAGPTVEGLEEVREIGHHLGKARATGEFVGLALFSKQGAKALRDMYRRVRARRPAGRFHNAERFDQAQMTDALQELLDRRIPVHAMTIPGGWLEINSFEDYQKAWETLKT